MAPIGCLGWVEIVRTSKSGQAISRAVASSSSSNTIASSSRGRSVVSMMLSNNRLTRAGRALVGRSNEIWVMAGCGSIGDTGLQQDKPALETGREQPLDAVFDADQRGENHLGRLVLT